MRKIANRPYMVAPDSFHLDTSTLCAFWCIFCQYSSNQSIHWPTGHIASASYRSAISFFLPWTKVLKRWLSTLYFFYIIPQISQLHWSLPQIEARGFCRRCESRPCSWSCSSPGWGRMPSCRSRWRRWSLSRRSCPASACEASSSSAEPPSPHPPSCARTCNTRDESAGIGFLCMQLVGTVIDSI